MNALLLLAVALGQETWRPPVKTVTLPKATRPVAELVEAVRAQTGLNVEASGLEGAAAVEIEWKDRPALAALDDLCRAMGRGSIRTPKPAEGEAGTLVFDGAAERPSAAAHAGGFRLEVTGVTVTTVRSLAKVHRTAQVECRWVLQPGVEPMGAGPLEVDEAIDSSGWALTGSSEGNWDDGEGSPEDPDVVIFKGRLGRRPEFMESFHVQLVGLGREAATIERLRVRASFQFPMHRVEGRVPAAELVEGRTIEIGPMTVTIAAFSQEKQQAKLSYRWSGGGRAGTGPQFELVDEAGEVISGGYGGGGSRQKYDLTYRLTRDVPVAALRYAATVGRGTIEVPFELNDIPLPKKPPR
jgi:hypothetical protein